MAAARSPVSSISLLLVLLFSCSNVESFSQIRPLLSRHPTAVRATAAQHVSRSRVLALDIQTFRDSVDMAGEMVLSRTVSFIFANILATLAWKGISGALESARPTTVVEVTRARSIPLEQWLKLIPCLLIDLGGDASYILPFLGEIGDWAWAPASALLTRQLFGSNKIAGLDFVKEALPFTDILPVATLAWALETFAPDSTVGKALLDSRDREKVVDDLKRRR